MPEKEKQNEPAENAKRLLHTEEQSPVLPVEKGSFVGRGGKILAVGMLTALGISMLGSSAIAQDRLEEYATKKGDTPIVLPWMDDEVNSCFCLLFYSCTYCDLNCGVYNNE